jgi:hypothetical protein
MRMRRAKPDWLSTKSSSVGWRDGQLTAMCSGSLVVLQRNPLPSDERVSSAGRDYQVVLRHLHPLQRWVVESLGSHDDVHRAVGQQRRNFPRVEMHGGQIQVGAIFTMRSMKDGRAKSSSLSSMPTTKHRAAADGSNWLPEFTTCSSDRKLSFKGCARFFIRGVGTSAVPCRSKSESRNDPCSRRRAWLTADCVRFRLAAARVTLRSPYTRQAALDARRQDFYKGDKARLAVRSPDDGMVETTNVKKRTGD